eukprot:m.14455 g.14455  ORF g.14455 m.14455 type:complete len:398 (-) comp10143_c0_seq1:29-1222(-)
MHRSVCGLWSFVLLTTLIRNNLGENTYSYAQQSSTMSVLRIGVIGAGSNTKGKHIPLLQALDNVEVVVVCNRSPESSQKVADEFNIAAIASNWKDVVEADNVDAIVIGTWPYTHKDITLAALAAGKHVLTEARMAMDATEARAMLSAARARPDLTAMIVPSPFTLAWDPTIQKYLQDGKLGQLLYVDVRCAAGKWADTDSEISWRQSAEFSGLNTMMLGIFYEAVRRWVGDAKQVTAMSQTFVKTRMDASTHALASIRIPDHINVIAQLDSGAQMHMMMSDVAKGNGRSQMEVTLHGSQGELHIDITKKEITFYEKGKDAVKVTEFETFRQRQTVATDGVKTPLGWRVEEEFVNAIRNKERVALTRFEDGLNYMQFTEAVALSCHEGRAVALPLVGK